MRRFRQLTRSDRLKIEALEKAGISRREIAGQIGVHISTVYRADRCTYKYSLQGAWKRQIHPHKFRLDRGNKIFSGYCRRKI